MEAIDKKLQEILSKKFEGAEVDVDPAIWDNIHTSLHTPAVPGAEALVGSKASVFSSWITWVAASVLIVGVITWSFWPAGNAVEAVTEVEPDPVENVVQPIASEEEANAITEEKVAEIVSEQQAEVPVLNEPEPTRPTADLLTDLPRTIKDTDSAMPNVAEDDIPAIVDAPKPDPIPVDNSTAVVDGPDEASSDAGQPADPLDDPVIPNDLDPASDFDEPEKGILRPLPNVFSPNGDGRNDTYLPEFIDPQHVEYTVVSMSSGNPVLTVMGAIPWTGVDRNGQELPVGPYLFIVKTIDKQGVTDQATQLVRLYR